MAAAAAAAATAFASSANGWPVAVADSQWNGRRDGRMPNAKGVKKREAKTSPACPPAMDGNEYQIPIDLSEGVREGGRWLAAAKACLSPLNPRSGRKDADATDACT